MKLCLKKERKRRREVGLFVCFGDSLYTASNSNIHKLERNQSFGTRN